MPVHYQFIGRSAAAIVEDIETGIRDGGLPADAVLPSVRDLAGQLRVSPATVAGAYRTLRERGLVETAGRRGTRVRSRPPLLTRAALRPPGGAGLIDLATGGPTLLPELAPVVREVAAVERSYGYQRGGVLPELRTVAGQRLAADGLLTRLPTGLRAEPGAGPAGQVDLPLTLTGGALDAIERVLAAHLRPGDRIGVEDPGWANLLDLVPALGLTPVPVPVDDCGPTEAGVAAALAGGVRALLVTSRAQNPTGAALTPDRALALRQLLAGFPQTLVIEDDHAAELAEVALNPLVGSTGNWAFVRSVSKPYGPDLRLAVVVGDEVTIARVEGRMRLGTGWVSTLLQQIVLQAWQDPAVARAVASAQTRYAQRRTGLLAALAERGVPAQGRTGLNVWVPVPDETVTIGRLREAGYAVAPGAMHRLASPPGVRITVGALEPERIPALADVLAGVLHQSSRSAGPLTR